MRIKTIFLTLIVFLLLAGAGISIYNRANWGTWVPTWEPERIDYNGRRYYPGGWPDGVNRNQLKLVEPGYYWGRGLYLRPGDSENATPMIIFLKQENGGYSSYVLSGGP